MADPTIEGFQKFNDPAVPSSWQNFIKANISDVNEETEGHTYLAKAKVLGSDDKDYPSYATGSLQEAQMMCISASSGYNAEYAAVALSSWYQQTYVFIYDSNQNAFKTYTPMLQSNLYMVQEGGKVYFKTIGTPLMSLFRAIRNSSSDGTSYEWFFMYLSGIHLTKTDGGPMELQTRQSSSGTHFFFDEPFKSTVGQPGTPKDFVLLTDLPADIQEVVNTNIPFYAGGPHRKFVAYANFGHPDQFRLYVDLFLLKAKLDTKLNGKVDFSNVSWNQYYFVFVEKEKDVFEVFTPIAKNNLGLAINQDKEELFLPDPPKGWTQFEFVTTPASEDYWLWRVKGEGLYLHFDPKPTEMADMFTFTDDTSQAVQVKFASEHLKLSPVQSP